MKMTDSENSQPQDDSDEDIYKDIPEFNFEEELAKLEGSKENYKQEAYDLSEKVKNLTEENRELKKLNEVLKRNLSVLLKTAQAEVQRKDCMIEELRSKIESFTFRRSKVPTNDKLTSTEDLNYNFVDVKQDSEKQKKDSEKIKSKSYENRTCSDNERRSNQGEEKKSDSQSGKSKNSNCYNNRKSGYHREHPQNSNSQQWQSNRDGRSEGHKEKKSSKYEDCLGQRRPFRESHRDHLQYDSYDNKRHSRSSDNRFLSRRRSSRERRRDHRVNDSSDRRNRSRRQGESEEKSRRDSEKKRSRSVGSKESSLEKLKSRSSLDNDPVCKSRTEVGAKSEGVKSISGGIECKKRVENFDKNALERGGEIGDVKSQQSKEKILSKNEKRKNSDLFSTKSPLDALYNDMVASRSSNRFLNPKLGTSRLESDVKDGELFVTECHGNESNEANEDWALSFKNERKNEAKPITLYSKRMMRKFSSDSKGPETAKKGKKEKSKPHAEWKSREKTEETDKEPGELTDDENVIESSKEFQELTKVAAIESEIIEKPEAVFSKEPFTKEFVPDMETTKGEQMPKDSKELEKGTNSKEELTACKEIELSKETRDVIEFSPFKNNYKLIEISLIKSAESENILDYYKKKLPAPNQKEQSDVDASDEKTKPEKEAVGKRTNVSDEVISWKNSSSENNSGVELEFSTSGVIEKLKESETVEKAAKEKECEKNEEKESSKRREKKSKEEINVQKEKKKLTVSKETEKLIIEEMAQKRKRKSSETGEGKSGSKKLKVDRSEPSRKSFRSKRSSKSDAEGTLETQPGKFESQAKEDILSFEFFKPIARAEPPETPTDAPKTDYKMAATMSVTNVVRLETPNKCGGKLKNLMINEQVIFNVFDSKNSSPFSPPIGSKSIEMTPRRMLKNDLMLSDSEDDTTLNKKSAEGVGGEEEEEEGDKSESEYSDCDSDSGASDFVDLL